MTGCPSSRRGRYRLCRLIVIVLVATAATAGLIVGTSPTPTQLPSAIARPGTARLVADLSSAPCFGQSPTSSGGGPNCTSTDPAVTFAVFGGTVSCNFTTSIDWGDGANSSGTYSGQANNGQDDSWTNTYSNSPGTTWNITVTTTAIAPCSGSETFNLTFTLAAPLTDNAGPDQTVYADDTQLDGSDNDSAATLVWTQVSGPAPASIDSPDSLVTAVTVPVSGDYVFELIATDGSQTASAGVTIHFDTALNGGTFINLIYSKNLGIPGEECTTGFGATDGTAAYELGAKHCIDGNLGNQTNNSYVKYFQPMKIEGVPNSPVYAASINCLLPADCLLPKPNASVTGDMMAWKPDAGVNVTDLVQTGLGPLPVVGVKTLAEERGSQVCHYGAGSAASTDAPKPKSPEQCTTESVGGYVLCSFLCAGGTQIIFGLFSTEGDSGGPLYSYDYSAGKAVGVYAVGIVIGTNKRLGATQFIPIKEVDTRLGVNLLMQAAQS